MNSPLLAAGPYLWEYHEPFMVSAMRWIINVGGYGIVALVVGSIIWKAVSAASNKSPAAPPQVVSDDRQDVSTKGTKTPQADAVAPDHTSSGGPLLPTSLRPPASDSRSSLIVPPSITTGFDTAERLQTLGRLRDQGLVSAEAYEAKRQQILQDV